MPSLNPVKIQSPYSFSDLVGSIVTTEGTYKLTGGNVGAGQVTVAMRDDKSGVDVAPDGTALPYVILGNVGTFTLEMQQTSSLHHYLLAVYNTLLAQVAAGIIENWAANSINYRTISDGSTHIGSGAMFQKLGDKGYASAPGKVIWAFLCCDIQNY